MATNPILRQKPEEMFQVYCRQGQQPPVGPAATMVNHDESDRQGTLGGIMLTAGRAAPITRRKGLRLKAP